MSINDQIKSAIDRSISHNEIVAVEVEVERPSEIRGLMEDIEGVDNVDSANENDGSLDVWGTCDGDDFRIRVFVVGELAAALKG